MAKICCGICKSTTATIMCSSEELALCDACDSKIHSANSSHERISLIKKECQSNCDSCQVSKGLFFCVEHRFLFCGSCDSKVHSTKLASAHKRFLVSGISAGKLKESESSSQAQGFPWWLEH